MPDFFVNGIVSARDGQPYIQLSNEAGMIGQFTMAEARAIAMDILVMCSRSEADSMIHKFFARSEFPKEAGVQLMHIFREFRMELDQQAVTQTWTDPETGETHNRSKE